MPLVCGLASNLQVLMAFWWECEAQIPFLSQCSQPVETSNSAEVSPSKRSPIPPLPALHSRSQRHSTCNVCRAQSTLGSSSTRFDSFRSWRATCTSLRRDCRADRKSGDPKRGGMNRWFLSCFTRHRNSKIWIKIVQV